MNAKPNLSLIVVALLIIVAACSPTANSLPILDQAQPEERYYKIVPLEPVTGQNVYDYEQEARAYPSQQLHSNCLSNDSQRQEMCQEKEPQGAIFLPRSLNIDSPAYPSQKLHSDCLSEDIQRQDNCVE